MTATLDLLGARRLFQAIRDEPACDNPACCPKENPSMTRFEIALRVAKYVAIGWGIGAVVFLTAAMVFGEDFS